ncbi:MAG: SGNH/GDSL hydrolase family protein [Euryarchaeota archaeon]|jgi:lysophospholipase L1-like esterase|uniref:Lipolytic enzyme, G-D-S-L family n=1 Tax=Methanothrix harundinacea TaxID=301375 RepID=A0A101IF93_9EURY|nr:MAG: Lipolytic enzyme, G-D-S-L family [Methanothrix harundinacea]MCP1391174.1 SGNH/GDSL hydrolase family protein [Methanothrix harundinacea]MDD3710974.1 SGNH/GDSL hydrolase family protein [Methanothrix sp.]MDI9398755.1 SGNH/GDSL hydrolase family protein [Euryarchaeota archaeon]
MKQEESSSTKNTVTLLEAGEQVQIVAFGDSISAGFAVRKGFDHFWLEMLKEKYPQAEIAIKNEGVCGATSFDGLARLDWSVIAHSPDLVTVNFGINDMYMGIRLGEFKSNVIEITEKIIEGSKSEILLLSSEPLLTPKFDKIVLSYYQTLEDVAEEMEVGFVDVYGAWMRKVAEGVPLESLILSGLDHPNELGYEIIAEELMRFF